MVCMQSVLYQTGESFFWISLVWPERLARPTRLAQNSVGLKFAILDSTLKWDKIEVLDPSSRCLLYWFLPRASRGNEVTETLLRWQLYGIAIHWIFCIAPCYVKCASNAVYYKPLKPPQVPASEKKDKKKKPTEETHARQLMHAHTARSHSHSHHRLWERILKVCFTKLGRGGRIFSFSPSSGRCVFARERQRGRRREREWSSAGQVISLSQWESTPWNSPREAGKAAFIIFLFYYCQNSLYFTFCSWRPFLLILVSVPFECFGSSGVFGAPPPPVHLYIYRFLKCTAREIRGSGLQMLRLSAGAVAQGLSVTTCSSENEPLALDPDPLSKASQHARHSSWDGNVPVETLAEQIWL